MPSFVLRAALATLAGAALIASRAAADVMLLAIGFWLLTTFWLDLREVDGREGERSADSRTGPELSRTLWVVASLVGCASFAGLSAQVLLATFSEGRVGDGNSSYVFWITWSGFAASVFTLRMSSSSRQGSTFTTTLRECAGISALIGSAVAVGAPHTVTVAQTLLMYSFALLAEQSVRELRLLTSAAPTNADGLRQALWRPSASPSLTAGSWRNWALWVSVGLPAIAWIASGIVIVNPGEVGVLSRLGRFSDDPLGPGLHFVAPRPIAEVHRVSTRRIRSLAAGFIGDSNQLQSTPFLWTRPHGEFEFPIIVGDGAEAVAVNAVVRYRVGDEPGRIADFLLRHASPEKLLGRIAESVITKQSRGHNLDTLLVSGGVDWRGSWRQELVSCVERQRLGVEIVDFEILSVHPPIEASDAFLQVVNAKSEAQQFVTESQGHSAAELSRCRMMADTNIADAKVSASKRIVQAVDDYSVVQALSQVSAGRAAGVIRQRLWVDALARVLESKSFVVIDAKLPSGTQVWLHSDHRTPRQ